MIIKFGIDAKKISGTTQADDFTFSIIERPNTVVQSSSLSTVSDSIIKTTVPTNTKNEFEITVNPSWFNDTYSFLSITPSIASVSAQGLVKWVSNGLAKINIITPAGTKQVSRNISFTSGGSSYTEWDSWVPGSLCRHIEDAISSMIAGKTPSAQTSNYYADGSSVIPNPTRFTGSLNLNALSVSGGQNMVLISPRHVIGSHTSGTGPIYFRADDGTLLTRNVTTIQRMASELNSESDDNSIGLLDIAIPSSGGGSIVPTQFLPSNYKTKLLGATSGSRFLQMLRRKQTGGTKVQVLEVELYDSPSYFGMMLRKSTRGNFINWSSYIEGGDSNGAVFIPIDSTGGSNYKAVFVTSINTSWWGCGYANRLTEIQTIMNTLQPGYTLQTVSLASFPSY